MRSCCSAPTSSVRSTFQGPLRPITGPCPKSSVRYLVPLRIGAIIDSWPCAGNIWKNLPPEEQETWKKLAKKAKAEHRQMYPNYRFRPVHNKNKIAAKRKDKAQPDPDDERRCEEVAQLLLDGKKGEELSAAVRQLEMSRSQWSPPAASPPAFGAPGVVAPAPLYAQRRPSSVPPPTRMYNPISIPTVPFFGQFPPSGSRPESPVGNIARSNRFFLGQRRPSSTGPTYYGAWTNSQSYTSLPIEQLQRDEEPLPDVPSGLFNMSFGFSLAPQTQTTFSVSSDTFQWYRMCAYPKCRIPLRILLSH